MNKQIKRISLLVSAALLLGAESVLAAVPVTLPLNSTKYMTAPKITRIAVGNPEIFFPAMISFWWARRQVPPR